MTVRVTVTVTKSRGLGLRLVIMITRPTRPRKRDPGDPTRRDNPATEGPSEATACMSDPPGATVTVAARLQVEGLEAGHRDDRDVTTVTTATMTTATAQLLPGDRYRRQAEAVYPPLSSR